MKIIRSATIGLSLNIFCKEVLRDLSLMGYEVLALSSPDKDLEELAQREGVRAIGVNMDRHINLLSDVKSLFRLVRVFRKEKPDMVHSMTPKAGLLCMMAAWMARVPIRVHTFTGLVWPTATGLKRKVLMTTDKLTCACATHVIPEGQGVLEDMRDYGITDKPLKVLGYGNVRGIDLSYWRKVNSADKLKSERVKELKSSSVDPKTESQAYEVPFTFLFVGRIAGDKGINELVEAFNKLIERKKEKGEGKNCRLVLVGWIEDNLDPVRAETRQMIESMPEIVVTGPQYGDELKAWYEAADCFVFPSYREGFPNTVIEASAMELPCIVTDINGSREIVIGDEVKELKSEEVKECRMQRLQPGEKMSIRENGVVIPSKNSGALYEAMIWMIDHEAERKEMGERGRQIVAERFEQSYVREQLYAFYREVFSKNR